MRRVTKEDFIEEYPYVTLNFTNYYKYEFTFKDSSGKVTGTIGGNSDEIYRLTVTRDSVVALVDLDYASDGEIYFDER